MSRVLSIASSFFAASFIVLMFLGLLAWGGTAAMAAEPLTAYCGGTDNCSSDGDSCDSSCCCTCEVENGTFGCYSDDEWAELDGCDPQFPCG
jgi:hypothetical protein